MDSKEIKEAADEQVIKLGWVDDGTAEPEDIKRAFIAGVEFAVLNNNGKESAEQYFYNHKRTFDGMNAGSYLDEEDFLSYAKLLNNNSYGWKEWINEADVIKHGYYLVYDPNCYGSNKIEIAWYNDYNQSWYQGSDCIHPTHYQLLPSPPIQQPKI